MQTSKRQIIFGISVFEDVFENLLVLRLAQASEIPRSINGKYNQFQELITFLGVQKTVNCHTECGKAKLPLPVIVKMSILVGYT